MSFFQIEWKMTVPNAITLARIVVLPLFVWLYLAGHLVSALILLVLSGISDLFDGMIARKFNQITYLGKLLDPVADKLTQVTVMACLSVDFIQVRYLLAVCVIKEFCQGIGGLILLHRGAKLEGARWYGKVSTFIFYGAMSAMVFWKDSMKEWILYTLIGLVALIMLFALFRYMRDFFNIKRLPRKRLNPPGFNK